MSTIIYSVIIVSVIGLIAGAGLSIASALMNVPVDEKIEKINEILPGANCGGCGFSGCQAYAEALVSGDELNTALCSSCSDEDSSRIASVLGIEAAKGIKKIAIVRCMGTRENTDTKINYKGVKSCRAAKQLFSGGGNCTFGCIGYGDCEKACPKGAIHICNGLAVIDPELCVGCGLCAKECPKEMISIVPAGVSIVRCKNHDKGAVTRKVCSAGCIGCGLCAKKCPNEAITVENFLASIDPEKCNSCGECINICPRKCIM